MMRFDWMILLFFFIPSTTGANEVPKPFSHDDWTTVLQEFVDDRGLVDYQELARQREIFDRYIAAVESSGPRSRPEAFPTRDHRLAFYINAYNAQIFNGVLDRGPEEISVWRGLISGLKFFVRRKITVDGEEMSLKSFEDKLIREGFQDPRIHAALNCASISCPRLPRSAFQAETLQEDLDAAMREFVADPRNCSVDRAKETVYLSEIFDFFPEDFIEYEKRQGNTQPRLTDYVNRYRVSGQKIPRDYRILYYEYDKGINKQ